MGEEQADAGSGHADSAGGALACARCTMPGCAGGATLRSGALITSVAADLVELVFRNAQVAAPAARPND